MPARAIFSAVSISIHAPRGGSDFITDFIVCQSFLFQSTLPAGGATYAAVKTVGHPRDFNPRSPRGERLQYLQRLRPSDRFQSTLPAGGATYALIWNEWFRDISIHAPRGGSDSTVKAYSNDRIKRSTLREPHFLFSKNACFSPIFSMCATTSRTKNQRIRVSFGSYPGLAPMCFTLDWYRFPRL